MDDLRKQFKRGGADHILRIYMRLHERTGKIIGEHWIWCALERIALGESEESVLSDYMYLYSGPRMRKAIDVAAIREVIDILNSSDAPYGCQGLADKLSKAIGD